jgi:hypothetical protein
VLLPLISIGCSIPDLVLCTSGIAWNDDIEDLSFTEARPTAADLDMMMFFCSSAEKLVR